MLKKMVKDKNLILAFILALIIVILSCWNEKFIFLTEKRNQHWLGWGMCKLAIFMLAFQSIRYWKQLKDYIKNRQHFWNLLFAFVSFVLLLLMWKKLGIYPLIGDELNIYNAAIEYDFGRYFTCYTEGFYGICMMLIPWMWSVVIVKLLCSVLVMCYCVERLQKIFRTPWLYGLYLFFFLPSVALGISICVHRLQMYLLVYMLFIVKLFCDSYERTYTKRNIVTLTFMGALLTQWRVEGIYLLILLPILLLIAFPILKKHIWNVILLCMVFQLLIYLPNRMTAPKRSIGEQLFPFYAYVLTNMIREGLDIGKNQELLEKIDPYLDMDKIHFMNEELGEDAYGDGYILWKEGYIGWQGELSAERENEFGKLVFQVIYKNIPLYIKSQIKSIHYISDRYMMQFQSQIEEGYARGILYYMLLIVTSCEWIPLFLLLLFGVIFAVKKNWLLFWIMSCGISSAFIVGALAPASYFKYFIVSYTMGYGIFYLWLIVVLKRAKENRIGVTNG